MRYVFNINPVPKPRQTRSDKWRKRPVVLKYRAFADSIREIAGLYGLTLGMVLCISFIVRMPTSWSKKKKLAMDGQPHQQRPDIDNLAKAFMDAMLKEDCEVWDLHATKRWGYDGKIIVIDD